jgi:hypothetical protein
LKTDSEQTPSADVNLHPVGVRHSQIAVTDVGLPQGDVPLALFAFNVGVEAG